MRLSPSGWRDSKVGKIKHKHYVVRKGRGFWLATAKMKALGFDHVRCGVDGPTAWAIAES
jgi:hypothetical protein